jgi:hypothetical protein
MNSKPELLPLRFMARMLRLPAKWLKEEALAGRVPCLDAGGQLMFNPVAVEAVLADRAAAPQSANKEAAHA